MADTRQTKERQAHSSKQAHCLQTAVGVGAKTQGDPFQVGLPGKLCDSQMHWSILVNVFVGLLSYASAGAPGGWKCLAGCECYVTLEFALIVCKVCTGECVDLPDKSVRIAVRKASFYYTKVFFATIFSLRLM